MEDNISENSPDLSIDLISDSEDEISTNNEQTHSGSFKCKKRSEVWNHFNEIKINGASFSKCKYCPTKYSISSKGNKSTGNMKNHLLKFHKKQYNPEVNEAQSKVTDFYKAPQTINAIFSRDNYRHAALKWIVTSNQPHTEIEQAAFINVLKSVNPALPVSSLEISADTIKMDIMNTYGEIQTKIKSIFMAKDGKISFSHDIWTSKNQLAFLGVTAHWISEDWEPKFMLVGFPNICGTHSGENIAALFSKVIGEAGIQVQNVFWVTTDNASSNDTFFKEFGELCAENQICFSEDSNRVRCAAHILNLCVQDLLTQLKVLPTLEVEDEIETGQILEIDDDDEIINNENSDETKVIIKLRKLVRAIRASPQKIEKLAEKCRDNNIKDNKLIIDVKTRWNSTYLMITRAQQLKIPIIVFCTTEPKFQNYLLTDEDWRALDCLQQVLQHFDRATQHLSMSRNVTISSVVPMFDWLNDKLKSYVEGSCNPALKSACSKALDKLQKYFPCPDADILLFVAVVINPAFKLQYFKEHSWDNRAIKKIRSKVIAMYLGHYNGDIDSNADEDVEDTDDFMAHLSKRSKREKTQSEVEIYLGEPTVSTKVNTLEWWKVNENKFPNLSKMARDVFSVQPTSVPIEREFSGGVDLVVPSRCRLSPTTISASMCLKSWWKTGLF
ncbi:putative AC transposase [Folsomia candida]|uniref:Putative AC transposase n=1 Tax=Folsomia candida TaxID=158441 RepID=A0A226DRS0_FOLCA|nr:putative AC transposase [Folsomia candida]